MNMQEVYECASQKRAPTKSEDGNKNKPSAHQPKATPKQRPRAIIPRDKDCRFVSSLNPVAVRIMVNWYERNKSHPYPSSDTCTVMAKSGGITVEQVKKWFANKRRRNNNTKSVSELALGQRRSRGEMEETEGEMRAESRKRKRIE